MPIGQAPHACGEADNGHTMRMVSDPGELRLGDLLGALSYALDLTEGQDAGHTLRSCLIGMTLGERLGLDDEQRSELYYALLLKDIGCSTNSARTAALLVRRRPRRQAGPQAERLDEALRPLPLGGPRRRARGPHGRAAAAAAHARPAGGHDARVHPPALRARRADRGGPRLPARDVDRDLLPRRALGRHRPPVRPPRPRRSRCSPAIACLSQTMEVFTSAEGARAALQVAHERRGRWFDPELVDRLDLETLTALPYEPLALAAAVSEHEPPDQRPARRRGARERRRARVRRGHRREVARRPAGTRTASPRSPAPPPSGSASPSTAGSCAPPCCTTSASSASPTGSSTSRARSSPTSGPRSARTRSARTSC